MEHHGSPSKHRRSSGRSFLYSGHVSSLNRAGQDLSDCPTQTSFEASPASQQHESDTRGSAVCVQGGGSTRSSADRYAPEASYTATGFRESQDPRCNAQPRRDHITQATNKPVSYAKALRRHHDAPPRLWAIDMSSISRAQRSVTSRMA